eukprot:TRINITY_DN14971_c0_g1_i1.p1 TRINITY_DN14971_c0_g1~~TRINITY_DN14971_c0_g1_i1.p1  ORF type:complete len:640 (-),score=159.25 TRINITY_DN14971_c0_g1_i1:378-2297(-)
MPSVANGTDADLICGSNEKLKMPRDISELLPAATKKPPSKPSSPVPVVREPGKAFFAEHEANGRVSEESKLVRAAKEWLRQALEQERNAVCGLMEARHEMLVDNVLPVLGGMNGETAPFAASADASFDTAAPPDNALETGDVSAALQPVVESLHLEQKKKPEFKKLGSFSAVRGALGQFVSQRPTKQKTIASEYFQAICHPGSWNLDRMVNSSTFEAIFSGLILLNAIVMAMEVQYNGADFAQAVGHRQGAGSAAELYPWAKPVLEACEFGFGLLFTLELVLKIVTLRCSFVKCAWNWLDLFVIVTWVGSESGLMTLPGNPIVFRLIRLLKVVRLLRALKTVQALDALQLLIGSIMASVSVLMWSIMILLMLETLVAMVLHQLLADEIMNENRSIESRLKLFQYFGSFSRTMITMFEMTVGNWVVVCRLLMEDVSEWYGLAILVYKLTAGFAVVKVITGVFMHETFKCAERDVDLMILQKERLVKSYMRDMDVLFHQMDLDRNGEVLLDEFAQLLADPRVSKWLNAMEVEVQDPDILFRLLKREDAPGVSFPDLVNGIKRLRGNARSVDVVVMIRQINELEDAFDDLRKLCLDAQVTTLTASDELSKQIKNLSTLVKRHELALSGAHASFHRKDSGVLL